MQRVKTATAVTTMPPYSEDGTPGFCTKGDPVAAIPATVPGQDWFNMVQEELLNLIKAAGLTPSAVDDTQLREAVFKLILAVVAGHNESGTAHADIRAALAGINIPTATEAVAGILKLASQAAAIAGEGGGAITPETLHGAISGVVRGYTKAQYAVPVALAAVTGAQAVDCDVHQELRAALTGAVTWSAPTHMALGKTVVLDVYAAAAQTMSWATGWLGNGNLALPTSVAAGKRLRLGFACVWDYASGGMAMQLMAVVPGV